jgi:hypothetical protein
MQSSKILVQDLEPGEIYSLSRAGRTLLFLVLEKKFLVPANSEPNQNKQQILYEIFVDEEHLVIDAIYLKKYTIEKI